MRESLPRLLRSFSNKRIYSGESMGLCGWSSASSIYEADTAGWGSDDEEEEHTISSVKLAPSLRSDEYVESKESVVDEEETESSTGSVRGKFKCEVCGVLLRKRSLLKQHMCSHSEDRSFVCQVEDCKKQYKRQDHLNRHSLTHEGHLFPCTWEGCHLSFNVNANLQRHLKLHDKWGLTVRGSKKAVSEVLCPEPGCGRTFKYPSLLQTHIDTVHDSVYISQAACMEPGCGEIFESPSELRSHTKVAHRFAFCDTCGISMLKTSLAAHARKHDAEQVLLRCPHPGCLHSYNKNANLNTHIRAVHKDLKPYGCSHAGCDLRFAYKCVRDKHEKSSKHSNPLLGGDFDAEDWQRRLKSRGGRKRVRLEDVDDLLPRKWRNVSLP